MRDVRQILLTHIHLDHAGATGTLVRGEPGNRGVRARARRAAPGRSVEARWRAPAGSTGRTWIGCGESSCRCPPSGSACCKGGERIAAGGPDAGSRLHAGARLASRQLLRAVEPASRSSATPPESAAAAARTSCRRRRRPTSTWSCWRDERGAHPRLGSGHAVPHALRPVPRRAPAFPGADGPAGRVEPLVRRLVADDADRGRAASSGSSTEALLDLRRVVGVAGSRTV